MYKIVALCALLSPFYMVSASLGHNLLNNSPLLYLLDLDKFIHEALVTRQIGNILYSKNYLESVNPEASIEGPYTDRPTDPAEGYQPSDGQWVWVPIALDSPDGVWYWVLRAHCYYLSFFISEP